MYNQTASDWINGLYIRVGTAALFRVPPDVPDWSLGSKGTLVQLLGLWVKPLIFPRSEVSTDRPSGPSLEPWLYFWFIIVFIHQIIINFSHICSFFYTIFQIRSVEIKIWISFGFAYYCRVRFLTTTFLSGTWPTATNLDPKLWNWTKIMAGHGPIS